MPRHVLRDDGLAPAENRRHAQKALLPCLLERAA
jgi:hypothetical protein